MEGPVWPRKHEVVKSCSIGSCVCVCVCVCCVGCVVTQMLVQAMGSGGSSLELKSWASNVTEGDVLGHFDRHPSSKGTDLFVNAHQERLGAPATHFLDCFGVHSIEMHRHGSSSSEGVCADVISGVAQVVETDGFSGVFEGGADVIGCDVFPEAGGGLFEAEDGGGSRATIGHDVVDSAGEGLDWAVVITSAFVVDALTFDATLLIRDSHGGLSSFEQFPEW